jgi:hypothetical protein
LRTDIHPRRPISLAVATFLALSLINTAHSQNIRGYYPGDWVTYTKTRFVTSIAIGWSDIYFGTTGGIIKYSRSERRWLDPITKSDGLPSEEIYAIAVSRDIDKIYVQTPLGDYSYDPTFQEWQIESEFPTDIAQSDLARYEDSQIFHFDPGYHMTLDAGIPYIMGPSLREYRVVEMVEDDWNNLWMATYGHGAAKVDLTGDFVTMLPNGVYSEDVQSVYVDGDDVWFGSKSTPGSDNAITRWNRESDEWDYYEARYRDWVSSDEVNEIVGDKKDIFLATDFGVVRYNKPNDRFTSYRQPHGVRSAEVYNLYLEDTLLFIGGNNFVDVLVTPRDSIFPMNTYPSLSGKILELVRIDGNFWIGTDYGVYRLNLDSGEWSVFNVASGHVGGSVWQIVPGNDGHIWFVGSDGIVHVDENLKEVESFLTQTDLKGDVPHRIVLDSTIMWVGTENGVWRYDRDTGKWHDYNTDDGLIDPYINDMVIEGDYIWFATPQGATKFYWNNSLRIRDY